MLQTLHNRYIQFICFALLTAGLAACGARTDPAETEVPLADLVTEEIRVELNPHDVAPLTAEVSFTTRVPTRVTLTVAGEEPVTQSFAEATEHRIPVLGLYPDTENEVTLRLESAEGYAETTERIQTEALPARLPAVTIATVQRGEVEPGWNLSAFRVSGMPDYPLPFMFDPKGEVRWYLNLDAFEGRTTFPRRLANGNLIFGFESALFEYTMLGEEVNRWEIPGYRYHHEITEKPDGNFIVAVDKEGEETVEDFMVEVERETGEIVREWDLRKILDVDRQTYAETSFVRGEEDWFHMNAIWYEPSDKTLVVSGRHQGVVKVTMENELVWILAPHKGWQENSSGVDLPEYLLTAVDEDGEPYPEAVQQGDVDAEGFSWVWGQHAPLILPNGNLFVFDNGESRNFTGNGTGSFTQDGPSFSRGVEYRIDEAAMTIEQVWQYGAERGEEFYSPIISDVDYLPQTNNRLVMPGIISNFDPPSYALMTEVTYPGKEVVFEARLEFKNLADGESVFGDSVYRFERLPLYPATTQ